MHFQKEIVKLLKKKSNIKNPILEIPPNPELGDYSFPCFKLGKNPTEESNKLRNKIKKPEFISDIKTMGPYLNFFIDKSKLTENVLLASYSAGKEYGHKKNNKKVVVIESPGPNTNKPLHLGHIRNMVLGNSLTNLNKLMGNKTIRVDIVNDRGIHICKSMLAYKKFGKNKKPNKKTDHFVGDYYVLYDKKSKTNKSLEKELNETLVRWEKNDKPTKKLWKLMNYWAVKGIKETYKRFGTKIDKYYFESKYYTKGRKIILKGLKKKLFQKDEKGNTIIDLNNKGLGEKVVLRSDNTSVYITQDIALADLRYKDYKMDEMIYVVANEQEYHFKALFEILKKLKYSFTKNLYHLAYGYISLPEGKMKSREGRVVDADNLADEMKDLAEKEIKKRNKNLSKKQTEKISEQIGMGAIKFFMLKYDPMKNFTYSSRKSIKFEGETGPYLQYTGVRINSILNKSKPNKKVNFSLLSDSSEINLIKHIDKYPQIIEKSTKEHKPSLICKFLIELCKDFNSFYQRCKVLEKRNKELTNARLMLTYCVGNVLKNGLKILGIEIPNKM
tara:strand:+ start:1190 stop:2863 length:1674 start_codon:yes stop_codon:yes gene_type:complete